MDVLHKLTYFDVSGKAEACRIAFSIAKTNFEDNRINHEKFNEIKETLPNNQLPILEIDNQTYCQSQSIFRYACKLAGLYPEDALDALRMDMLSDQIEECWSLIMSTMRSQNKVDERKELIKEEGRLYKRISTINNWIRGPWFNGEKMTGADINLYCFVNVMESGFLDGIPKDYFDQFENIRNLHEKVDSSREVISYYSIV